MSRDHTRPFSTSYQLFMLVLCLYSMAAMSAQSAIRLEPRIREILDYADYGVCLLFLLDFVVSFWQAERRWRYLLTWGWLDLLSSIPTIDIARWGRAARVLRVFRVLRGLRATSLMTKVVLRQRVESTFLAASLVALLLIVFSSVAILQFESGPDSNIKTAEDAIWWAITTITTVGYGDHYPVTSEGRFVAAILMCGGVGLFGIFSGFLAAWFIGPTPANNPAKLEDELRALRDEVAALRQALE